MKYLIGTIAVVALATIIIYIFWMPLPNSPARDAIGEEKIVMLDDRKIAYYVSGQGEPVLLAASAGREASDFNELVIALNEAGFQTLAVEAPGIKGSDMIEQPVDVMSLADDLSAVVVRELGNDKSLSVIGHAYGNRLVRAFAYKNDDRVNGVILIASGGSKNIPEKANAALKAIFDPRRTVSQRRDDIDYAFFAEGNDIPDHWMIGWHMQTAILQGQAKGSESYDIWGSGGTKAMLVLQAAEDTIAPPQDAGIPLAQQYPDRVKLVLVPQAGHALLPEQPKVIAEEVIGFLNLFQPSRNN